MAGLELVQSNELLTGTRLLLKGKETVPFTKVNGQTLWLPMDAITGSGLTVTVMSMGEPIQFGRAVPVGVTVYTMVPSKPELLVNTAGKWVSGPVPVSFTKAPKIFAVFDLTIQLNVLGTAGVVDKVITLLGCDPLHIDPDAGVIIGASSMDATKVGYVAGQPAKLISVTLMFAVGELLKFTTIWYKFVPAMGPTIDPPESIVHIKFELAF
jgi:hypothetical protein